MAANAALKATGLIKKYKDIVAVGGVDLTVERGECLALLGPNGAGKTTTVEMLEGLTDPDSGEIEVCGQKLTKQRTPRREIMEKVGVVLQETNLYKRYTVKETLELFASFFSASQEPAAIMERLGLTEKANAKLMQLSGGQKQRVYLGCALINNPELLFLDEPTTGLDPQARRHIWDLLAAIKKEGRSILLTTHYMEEAEILADRVAIIDHGKIIATGSPAQLIQQTCGDQVLWVALGEVDASAEDSENLKKTLASRLPWFAGAKANANGYEVSISDVAKHTQELFAASQTLGISVRTLQLRRSTLEDVFLKLTGRSMRDG